LALAAPALAADYDLVILNGRVMDPETNYDAVANVGVKDGVIAVITEDAISGKDVIDATGHVVAPGFIDTHYHWPRDMGYKLALRDGCTTVMDLELGSVGTYVDQWYKDREGKCQTNYGTASGHEFARSLVLDGLSGRDVLDCVTTRTSHRWVDTKLDIEDGNEVLRVIDEGLAAGAVGIGSTLAYMRDGVTAREMFEVQKIGAAYGRPTVVHLRFTPGDSTTEPNGAQEIMANAVALDAPAIICHFNNPGWELISELLVLYQKRGHNVWGEYYPYHAGSTALNTTFLAPELWEDQMGYKYEETILNPITGEFFTRESYYAAVEEDPTQIVILFKMPEEDIVKWLKMPGATIASDGMPLLGDITWDTPYEELPNGHPRTAGCHACSLRLARENGVPLMFTLTQLSYGSAKRLGDTGLEAMKVRGRMQENMVADIVVFDPENVADASTYEKGSVPSTGIPYVIVNGTVVVKDSVVLKGVTPGQPIRFEPEEPRFTTPLTVESWEEEFLVNPLDSCMSEMGLYDEEHEH
jgi:N-acyl-D-glutamate deacylase